MFAREMSPNRGVVNTVSSLALGSVGADAGGYIRVAGTFPNPVMTHSQHSKSAADITIPRLANSGSGQAKTRWIMEGRPTRSERTTQPHSVVDPPQLQTPVTKCDGSTKSTNCPENFFHALITPDCQIFPPYLRTREFSVNITSCNLQGRWNIAPPL